MVAKYRSTVLQIAPMGAVCSTVDLYLAITCQECFKNASGPVFREFTAGISVKTGRKLRVILRVLTQMVAKYRSTVLQTAPVGAVCSTVDLYLATICNKIIKFQDFKCPVFRDFTVFFVG